ncbi:hypothetical protein ACTA71_001197 [Dictyostelium dimigraforme]
MQIRTLSNLASYQSIWWIIHFENPMYPDHLNLMPSCFSCSPQFPMSSAFMLSCLHVSHALMPSCFSYSHAFMFLILSCLHVSHTLMPSCFSCSPQFLMSSALMLIFLMFLMLSCFSWCSHARSHVSRGALMLALMFLM